MQPPGAVALPLCRVSNFGSACKVHFSRTCILCPLNPKPQTPKPLTPKPPVGRILIESLGEMSKASSPRMALTTLLPMLHCGLKVACRPPTRNQGEVVGRMYQRARRPECTLDNVVVNSSGALSPESVVPLVQT